MEIESSTYLLDTQIFLWLISADRRLPVASFKERFDSENSEFIFHQASTWEIQIKYELKKLPLPEKPELLVPKAIKKSNLTYKTIEDKGIFFLQKLPAIHRDPFDRLLLSHAMVNGWTIITADKTLTEYPAKVELI